jgi:hypothetical protein
MQGSHPSPVPQRLRELGCRRTSAPDAVVSTGESDREDEQWVDGEEGDDGRSAELYKDVIGHSGTQWVAAMEVGDDLRDLSNLDSLKVVLRRLGQVIVGHEVVTGLILQASMHPGFEGEVEKALHPGVETLTALLEDLMAEGTLREVPPYVFISMFVDVLITTAGVERVKSPLYGADFSDPAVLDTLIDHLIDMLLAATVQARSEGG